MDKLNIRVPSTHKEAKDYTIIDSPALLQEFMNGAYPFVLVRNACCFAWVPLALLISSTASSMAFNGQTNGTSVFQFLPNVTILLLSLDTMVLYQDVAQGYSYNASTGEIVFFSTPDPSLNLLIIYQL